MLYQANSFDPQNVSEKEEKYRPILAVKVPRMRNNNLDIRIAGTSGRAKQPDFSDFRLKKKKIDNKSGVHVFCPFYSTLNQPLF